MNTITEWKVGDRVKITKESWLIIRNSNRSTFSYPGDSYVATTYGLMKNVVEGTVIHRFTPSYGYEITVQFDTGTSLDMRDNWVEKA